MTSPLPPLPPKPATELQAAYEATCSWYHRIDEFRAKLLGFLPFLSGVGILGLLKSEGHSPDEHILFFLAFSGFAITLGLLFYELRGVQRCIRLRSTAIQLELAMQLTKPHLAGPLVFSLWPSSFAGVVNEPIAAAIIYPAVLAAWTCVAIGFSSCKGLSWVPYVIFVLGFAGIRAFFQKYRRDPNPTAEWSENTKGAREAAQADAADEALWSSQKAAEPRS